MTHPSTTITSADNPRIKEACRLRRKPYRIRTGLMLVEGTREIAAAVEHLAEIQQVFHCDALLRDDTERRLLDDCHSREIPCTPCSEPVFRKLVYRENPGGLLAVARANLPGIETIQLSACPLLLVAVSLEKPGNLGAILRIADAANADAVVLCDACIDAGNPNVIRASAGARFSVQIATATTAEFLAWAGHNSIRVVAATPRAKGTYTDYNWTDPTAIALGTEAEGLAENWFQEADAQVRIPMRGKVDSLNVSTVASVLVFEALRRRG